MNPLDLKQREEQAAGNSDDSLNPGNRHYNDSVATKKEGDSSDEYDEKSFGKTKSGEYTDAHGDKVKANYNAGAEDDREALNDAENNPEKPTNDSTSGARSGLAGWLAKGGKKYGASGGVLGILGIGMIVISVMLSPAALFATIEKSLTNDGADSSRTNSSMFRAFRGGLFHGECTGSKLKCKFVTGTKQLAKKFTDSRFKINGTVVDSDGKQTSGGEREIKPDDMKEGQRFKLSSIVFPNGVRATSNAAFESETKRSVESRKSALHVVQDKTGFFFTDKFNTGVLKNKFKIPSKGTIAAKDSMPSERDKAGDQVRTEVENAKKKTSTLSLFSASNGVTTAASTACTAYNVVRVAVGAVKAKWILQVVTFALPFVQIASKLADGSATDQDREEIEARANQLVWYPSANYTKQEIEKVNANSDLDEEEKQQEIANLEGKQDLSATDAQGLKMAMYGDTSALKDFTLNYTTGGMAGAIVLSQIINQIQGTLGKENIRDTCIAASGAGYVLQGMQAAGCLAGGAATFGLVTLLCFTKQAAALAVFLAASYVLVDAATEALIKALMQADISSDLRGVDAGNALAAGIGLMLASSSMGSGLKPAKTATEVKQFITMTDDVYNQDYTEIAKHDAIQDPFNLYNQYSFASILNSSLNPYIAGKNTGYSVLANGLSIIKNAFNPSASALHSQPSLMTNNEANLNHRLNVVNGQAECPDMEKQLIGIVCDWSGRMVGVTSPRVLEWANQVSNGDMTPFYDTIDYMQQEGKYKEIGNYGEADTDGAGTFDDTCNNLNDVLAAIFAASCDDSRKPSINDDGSVVEKSQYSMYKAYCTEARELDLGSSAEFMESGSDKDQKWYTGEQCANDSMMMDRFAFYFNMCEVAYAMANGETDCVKEGPSKSTITQGSGDACSLMNNPNIVYVNEGTKKGLKEICETGKSVNSCGDTNYTLDQELMNVITTLSSKYKVWLNNFGFQYDRNMCGGGEHPKGKAIDLNGIEKIGGGKAGGPDWGGITYGDPKQVAVIQEYSSDWLAAIAPNHGGVGQKGCSGNFNPKFPANAVNVNGAAFFADSCDHLHIDVRDRGGASAL